MNNTNVSATVPPGVALVLQYVPSASDSQGQYDHLRTELTLLHQNLIALRDALVALRDEHARLRVVVDALVAGPITPPRGASGDGGVS